jgi:hypothetical protein
MAGVALLERIAGPAAEPGEVPYQLPAGSYQPGDMLGVASLLRGEPSARLVLVVAGQAAPLRWWIEQARAEGGQLRLVAATSAALEPLAAPYLDASGNLEGTVSGLSAAAYYEQVLRQAPGQASFAVIALAAGHIGVVGLLVLGALIYALRGARGRKA